VWWLHDAENYPAVEKNIAGMLRELDLEGGRFKKIPRLAKLVYVNYDKATEAKTAAERKIFFNRLLACTKRIARLSDANEFSGFLYYAWVKAFYWRFFAASLFFLFLYHLSRFPVFVWPFLVKPFYFLALAGAKGHNHRNRKAAEKYLEKYWRGMAGASRLSGNVSLFAF